MRFTRLTARIIAACASLAIATFGLVPTQALAAPQDELAVARRELEAYGEQLAEVQTQLVKGADELNITEYEIVERQGEADQTRQELGEAQGILAEHMRENYRAGNATLISVLLEAETVEDLVSRIYYLDKIAERNSNEIAQVRELQASLDQQISELEAQRDEQQRMLDEAAEQAQAYTERIAEAQAYYNELDAKVQAQLAAEAAAAAEAQTRQTNDYGVITDGMQNAIEVVTAEEPVATTTAGDQDEMSDNETSADETDEASTGETVTSEEEAADDTTIQDPEESAEDSEPTADETDEGATEDTGTTTEDPAPAEQTPAETSEDAETTEDAATADPTPDQATSEPEASTPEADQEQPAEEETQPVAAPTNDSARSAIISMAYQYLGVPYVWGGKSPNGFDCSGLTTYCYENCGVDVGGNRTTYQLISWIQSRGNWKTSMDELQPGDMIFPSAGHTAIYLPDDVAAKLEALRRDEDAPLARVIYDTMFRNQSLAARLRRPCCQDTGVLQFWLKCGTGFPLINELEDLLKEADRKSVV